MASIDTACNVETEHEDRGNNSSSPTNVCEGDVENLESKEDYEEEEEDTDFNPFLIAETSSEASSSLSSDDDVSGHVANKNLENSLNCQLSDQSLVDTNVTLNHTKDTGNGYMEAVKCSAHLAQVANSKDSVCEMPKKNKKLVLDSQKGKSLTNPEVNVNMDSCNDENNIAENTQNEELLEQSTNSRNSHKTCAHLDNEDAICRRTRARHSLANHTLEELEAFLQESDNEDNPQNVDDEEEYHKFLSAVLQGANQDRMVSREDVDCDEDEENDMDFEIEIEEALESDSDDGVEFSKHLKRDPNEDVCGPETRHKRSQSNQKKLVGPSKMPLRPILPSVSNAHATPFPQLRRYLPYSKDFSDCSSSLQPLNADFVQGFTAQQIGQLYCLLHEHIQLLIQVFSLCVLDPSRQHIAQNVRKLIFEMVEKREEALAWKKVPYPTFCFNNLHIHQSDNSDLYGYSEGSSWAPSVRNPIYSIFDFATLGMVSRYMTDVSAAVSKYRDSQVEIVQDKTHMTKQPLFHLSSCAGERSKEVTGNSTAEQNAILLSPSSVKRKMSLAATLVENTKKQSVAHVPKGIADLAQIFVPLFNSALFPRKPPVPAVANRVLFTDSEDRLLAMGLIEYNNDWAAIQQRYLPCKCKNQIFVRQKNRSSSKSPENPIKIVRRMKTSPLTANELILIAEGLKVFKNDWNAVWRFYVPYRDPSLLPRQWRIATGTQKSYRKSEIVRQKRNLYEAKRRKLKASMNGQQATTEKEVDDDAQNSIDNNMDEDDEAYVHEAFLAESEPGSSKLMQPPTSQAGALPYQMHKATTIKVVKLAPGLPPVNLPPSVRVISQSAFKSYSSVPSYLNIGDVTCNPVERSSDIVKIGKTSINPGRSENVASNSHPKTDSVQDPNNRFDHLPTKGNYLESDLTMHPLLFSASENGYQPHFEYHCSTSTSSALNVLSERQLEDRQNFLKFQQPDRIGLNCPTDHSKESSFNLHTIDFHPFLQRIDNVHEDSGIASQDNYASDNLEPFRASCAPTSNSSNGILSVREVNHGHLVPNAESTGQYEKESEIDLDIHLSTRNKGKKGGGFMASCQGLGPGKPSVFDKRMVTSSLPAKRSTDFQENCHDAATVNPSSPYTVANVVQTDHNSGAFRGRSCVYSEDDEGNAHFPEIVMEQEELSDSDEEFEQVEFECEEMDDSDDEQLDAEYVAELQNQDVSIPSKWDESLAEKNFGRQSVSSFNMSESIENSGNSAIQTHLCLDTFTAASFPPKSKQKKAVKDLSLGCSPTKVQSQHSQSKVPKAKDSKSCSLRRKKSS